MAWCNSHRRARSQKDFLAPQASKEPRSDSHARIRPFDDTCRLLRVHGTGNDHRRVRDRSGLEQDGPEAHDPGDACACLHLPRSHILLRDGHDGGHERPDLEACSDIRRYLHGARHSGKDHRLRIAKLVLRVQLPGRNEDRRRNGAARRGCAHHCRTRPLQRFSLPGDFWHRHHDDTYYNSDSSSCSSWTFRVQAARRTASEEIHGRFARSGVRVF